MIIFHISIHEKSVFSAEVHDGSVTSCRSAGIMITGQYYAAPEGDVLIGKIAGCQSNATVYANSASCRVMDNTGREMTNVPQVGYNAFYPRSGW